MLLILLLLVCLLHGGVCDMGYYVDSNAAFDANENVNLLYPPSVINEITTASVADAGTAGEVFITYVGVFSNSGPHLLGSPVNLVEGTTSITEIQLSRKIGNLKSIVLETSSTDCWLMDSINVDMYRIRYEIAGPNTWLEAVNATTGTYNTARSQVSLPSARYLELAVTTQYDLVSASG
eukprot:CAMPEP_0185000960 /NCGR_PEP_ID=MMETSP1098-20130426/69724_1 /TAXON_ID=89044 /ORGANISM="Spumella elongata, Strain CCAP 955/1" /LENGTH=178 /DNA_ID=CAMNT_0027528207 /DNA_START=21 /DNA_END=557 /DNA_ORIENTATION=+